MARYRAQQMLFRTWLSALASALVILYAKHALSKVTHSIRFLEPGFLYEYQEGFRKFIHDADYTEEEDGPDEDSASKQQQSTRVFAAALPLFSRLIEDARMQGIELGELPLRVIRPSMYGAMLHSMEQLAQEGKIYPHQLTLNLNAGDKNPSGINCLTLWLSKPLERKQAEWLWARAAELRFATLAQHKAEIQGVNEDTVKRFAPATVVTRVGRNFALSVGLYDRVRLESQRWLTAQAEALAQELFPVVERTFRDAALRKEFFTGDSGQLISLDVKLGKRPQGAALAQLFNPYGPPLDALGCTGSPKT